MTRESAIATISEICSSSLGVFRGRDAIALGVSRNQLAALRAAGVVERVLPDTYRMTAVGHSHNQSLRAALLWAGPNAAAAGRSAAELYRLVGVQARQAEIAVPRERRLHSARVVVHRPENHESLMIRRHHGLSITGIEATLDANDYEFDNEKWSVPGRHGCRVVLATWDKVTRQPARLLAELATTLAA